MKRPMLGLALCGGASRRMGESKALLEIRPGLTQLAYALELLDSVCEDVAVGIGPVPRSEFDLSVSVAIILDAPDTRGPMAGVIAGLRHATGRPMLVIACDMPYLEPSLLVQLVNRRDASQLATAFVATDGSPDPMCAIYESASLATLEALAKEGKSSLRRFLLESPVERIPLDRPELLASVNDRRELDEARRRLAH